MITAVIQLIKDQEGVEARPIICGDGMSTSAHQATEELYLLRQDPCSGLASRRDDFLVFVRGHVGTDTSTWSFWDTEDRAKSRDNLEQLFINVCVWFRLDYARVQVTTLLQRPEGDTETEFYFWRQGKRLCGCTSLEDCSELGERTGCRLNGIVKCCHDQGRIGDLRYLMMASYVDDMIRASRGQGLADDAFTWMLASKFNFIFKEERERLWGM